MPTRPRAPPLSRGRTAVGALRSPILLRFGSASTAVVVDFPEIDWALLGFGVPLVFEGGFLVCLRYRGCVTKAKMAGKICPKYYNVPLYGCGLASSGEALWVLNHSRAGASLLRGAINH